MSLNDRMARAEDYVFGLMDERERERAERDMLVDPEFRECVMALAARLRRLRDSKGPISIADEAWDDIAQRIATLPQMSGGGVAMRLGGAGQPAPDPSRKGFLGVKRPYAHQFGGVRGTAIAIGLAAALAVGYVVGQSVATSPDPEFAALLADENGSAGALVEAYAQQGLRVLPLAPLDVPERKVLQLWVGETPVAVLPRAVEAMVQGPELPAARAGEVYELTLEDAPGVSSGQGKGQVVLSGRSAAVPR